MAAGMTLDETVRLQLAYHDLLGTTHTPPYRMDPSARRRRADLAEWARQSLRALPSPTGRPQDRS